MSADHESAWDAAEDWWEAQVGRRVVALETRVDLHAQVLLAQEVLRARRNACGVAEAELMAAVDRMCRTRNEMEDACNVLELALRAVRGS